MRARREVSLTKRDFSSVVRISPSRWEARRRAVVRRRLRHLGSGDWASLYTSLGPNRDLIGRTPDHPQRPGDAGNDHTLAFVRARTALQRGRPCQIAGRIHGSGAPRERDLAIAVNGRIEAVGRSFHLKGESVESYSVMVPEDACAMAATRWRCSR